MKLLVVTHHFPALDSGAGKRNYYLLQALIRANTVSLLIIADDLELAAKRAAMLEDFVEAIYIAPALPARIKRLYQLAGLLTRQPSIVWQYSPPRARRLLRHLLAEQTFDAVVFESVTTAAHRLPSGVRMIVDEHNLEYELLERSATMSSSFLRAVYYRYEAAAMRSAELQMLRRANLILLTSERERDLLLHELPDAHAQVIPNGVDVADFSHTRLTAAIPRRVVFTGAMDYYPNQQAALFFAKRCWPAIHAAVPDATWSIVGRAPSPAIQALGELPGVMVTGTVPEIQPFLMEACVAVAPILVGSGTRLKILEALAMGTPVVSTTIGYEGLNLRPNVDLLVADDASHFADAVISLLRDDALRARMSAAGRDVVVREYEWQSIGDRLLEALARLETQGDVSSPIVSS